MNIKKNTYLDFAATTPVDFKVFDAMKPYFSEVFGNPSSVHTFGQQAEGALEHSRELVSQILNCKPKEIIFTSCGSESDNLSLRGAAMAARRDRDGTHILISPVEHHAVTHTARQLQELYGFELEYLPTDEHGRVEPDDVASRLKSDTAVVSVIFANNEIGTINPIGEIGAICRERGVPFHTDAVQAAAYLPVDVETLNVDLLAISAHKFYGPKGVGVLYCREGTAIIPSQTGGGQEFDLRAGTSNIPYIVGLAEAFRIAQSEREQLKAHLIPLRDIIIRRILEEIPHSRLTGHPTQRLPNHSSFVIYGVDGNALLMMLDVQGYACSSGSACKTGDPEPSSVLVALGIEREWALGSLRVTLGKQTTHEDIEGFLTILPEVVKQARNLS